MKSIVFAFLISVGIGVTSANAGVVKYPDGLALDTGKDDVTVQELPAFGKGTFLCFWTGDTHLAFVKAVHEKNDQDLKSFIAAIIRGAKKERGDNVKMTEGAAFKTADQREARRYDLSFYAKGELVKALYYVVKTDTGYYSVVVTMVDPTAYPFVRTRMEKIMATARIDTAMGQK